MDFNSFPPNIHSPYKQFLKNGKQEVKWFSPI